MAGPTTSYFGTTPNADLTPADAARILRQHFGMVADPATPDTLVGDPTGAIALAGNRRSLQQELDDRLVNDKFSAALGPQVGFEPGSPGKPYASNLPAANLIADREQAAQLERDQASDPFTGAAEQARVGGVQKALDQAATIQRPEIGDASETVAKRNAFAEYMKEKGLKMGGYEAAASPAAQAAAMVPINTQLSDAAQAVKNADLRREQQKMMSPSLIPGQMPEPDPDNPGQMKVGMPPNFKPLNAQEGGAIENMEKAWPMIQDLKGMLDPMKDQISQRVGTGMGWFLYNRGISPDIAALGNPQLQRRMQLASLIKIIGSSPYATQSRNYAFIQDVQKHLTNPVATDKFLASQIDELEQRWPEIQRAIIQKHVHPDAPLGSANPARPDKYAPPTDAELGIRNPYELNR